MGTPVLRLRRHIKSRRGPRWTVAHRLAGLLVALAVVSGLTQARLHYFYCEALGLSLTDPCALSAQDRPPCPSDAFEAEHSDCCRHITMPAMPDGARPAAPFVAPAGLVATLPAVPDLLGGWTRSRLGPTSPRARSRASPPLARQRCATLMVFRT